MNPKLISKSRIVDNEETTIWTIVNNNVSIEINELFDSVSDCNWLDKKHNFIEVNYSDWTENDLVAILTSDGEIIRDAIYCIEEIIEEHYLFIVRMSGAAMEEASYYGIASDEKKCGLIDQCGDFIIDPDFLSMEYDKEENIIYASNYTPYEFMYSLDGKQITEEKEIIFEQPPLKSYELFGDFNFIPLN
ncbi:MAG: hypothetical protein WCP69_13080 [Bacteroidota bacterium]